MNPRVKCIVENCKYHEEGNYCSAKEIMISTAQVSLEEDFNGNPYEVDSSFETLCHTFVKDDE